MNKELNQIKKIYGEEMMHLCRELFPSLLEQEGVLLNILKSNIAPTRSFASDIKENCLYDEFKSFVYSFIDVEEENNVITDKTPFELMDEAGYKLYECKSEEDIQSFRKYYAPGEVLCTIKNGGRLQRCHVFFAIKKNVDKIKRENFNNPKREDEYGTSVISIQFSRGATNTLSIKNRYNHSVNNPDATFSNNLDNIIPGLKNSFEKYYNFNIDQNDRTESRFLTNVLRYTKANDGRYYRYNLEIDGVYYCENNIIIEHGEVITKYSENKERYLLIDEFIVDKKDKIIYSCAKRNDSFVESINKVGSIERIDVTKNKENRNIDICYSEVKHVRIVIDKHNNIIGYENNYISEIGNYFLSYNEKLKTILLPNVNIVGHYFLLFNQELSRISLSKVLLIGNSFLCSNKELKEIILPEVQVIDNDFLRDNKNLSIVSMPQVRLIGDGFLSNNCKLTNISLPYTQKIGYGFLWNNVDLKHIELPLVKTIGDMFLMHNEGLKIIELPQVQIIGDEFLSHNEQLRNISVPLIRSMGIGSLTYNEKAFKKIMKQIDKNEKRKGTKVLVRKINKNYNN